MRLYIEIKFSFFKMLTDNIYSTFPAKYLFEFLPLFVSYIVYNLVLRRTWLYLPIRNVLLS